MRYDRLSDHCGMIKNQVVGSANGQKQWEDDAYNRHSDRERVIGKEFLVGTSPANGHKQQEKDTTPHKFTDR